MLKEEHKEFYDEIFPALDIYEDKRLEARKKTNILIVSLIPIYIAIAYLTISYAGKDPGLKFFVLVLLGSVFGAISQIFKHKYLSKFKRDVLTNLFEREGITINHKAYANIDGKHFAQSKMFKSVNRYAGNDLITGHTDDLFFIASELKASIKRDKSSTTIFDGIFLAADLPEKLAGETTIFCKSFRYRYKEKIPDNKFNSLSTEFEYYFNVDFTSYDDTSILLMPAFMKRLIAFRKKHKHPFILKVVGSKVYLAINEDKDFFKINMREKAYHQRNLKILSEDAEFFFDVVDLLLKIE